MSIGRGTHRLVTLDLLGAAAGALNTAGNSPKTLAKLRQAIKTDGLDLPKHFISIDRGLLEDLIAMNTDASRVDARSIVAQALKTSDDDIYRAVVADEG